VNSAAGQPTFGGVGKGSSPGIDCIGQQAAKSGGSAMRKSGSKGAVQANVKHTLVWQGREHSQPCLNADRSIAGATDPAFLFDRSALVCLESLLPEWPTLE
jgi:hypothetical protein